MYSTHPTLQTQLYYTQLYTQYPSFKKYQVSVPSQAIPHALGAGISVKTLSGRPHRSVGPTTGTHLPEEGG